VGNKYSRVVTIRRGFYSQISADVGIFAITKNAYHEARNVSQMFCFFSR